ncbi:MAG: HAD-IG family 5'-nucleotidase [Spirochaetaceae bacterium]|nr:HAD-IG family 5'-nucleotidase [Spirochaetaceae bacterium]
MPVYVNRLLNFKRIKVVGFDMDYTIVGYNISEFEGLTHSLAADRLVKHYDYPGNVASLEFDRSRAIVGLVVDKRNGNLLKLSRFGKVKLAYHGLEEIDYRERARLYRERVIDLRDPDFQSLDTAFAISNGVLFAQLVQLKKEGTSLPDYRHLAGDVNHCIDSLHKDGTLKSILKSDFGRYVVRDPKTAAMLERLKAYGKKLMIITNSDYSYTKALLDYALDPYWKNFKRWRDVFDLVITFADKPRFFEGKHRFLKIDPKTGCMSNHEGPVSEGLWQGGWFEDIQNGLDIPGDEFLYLGDHIYGDVVSIKKRCDWRTALVLGGLEGELKAIEATKDIQAEIDRLMTRKNYLEKKSDEAEMDRHFGGNTRLTEEQIAELDRLNNGISELLDELKPHFNPYWGEILRAGSEESRYAEQVEKYACIYMTRVSDLYDHSPRTYFRPPRRMLAHELPE